MSKAIELLPEHIIDQIKAGEVIERPSTLIKELLENSIDAGASKIKIHIINSGLDLISVEDDGHGISYENLPLAFCRHATSKIENFEDIYKLATYGFRGEALASIASVSKVTCQSYQKGQDTSTIKFEGGLQLLLEKDSNNSSASGTSFYIKDLFFNTPVRMKFIQSKVSEKNQLRRMINAFILTHPEIEFDITWDDESKVRYHSVQEELLPKRVKDLFEKRTNPLELIESENSYDGFRVRIILSKNSQKGNAGKFHYLFINDRIIQDIQIHKIILNSAKDLWPNGESGNYCVFIDAPSDQIDVNVHPNKTVVKIFQAPKLYSLISSVIKEKVARLRQSVHRVESTQSDDGLLDLIPSESHLSTIQYREQNFDQDFSMQTYFDSLDNKQNSDSVQKNDIVYQSKTVTLFSHSKGLLLIDNYKFIIFLMKELTQKDDPTPSPLLVSEPIKVEQSKSDEDIFALIDKGFEFDRLDKETLVLRSFPSSLTDYPYSELANYLIQEIQNKKEYQFRYTVRQFQITKALESQGLSLLIENQVMKVITDKDLLKILK